MKYKGTNHGIRCKQKHRDISEKVGMLIDFLMFFFCRNFWGDTYAILRSVLVSVAALVFLSTDVVSEIIKLLV